ncbi:MAG: DUF5114 domain-containing protein [Prevotella sp.]
MNKTKYILFSLLTMLSLVSCDKDGDTITTDGLQAVELSGSGDVVLDKNNTEALALTLNWTDNSKLTTNDERVQLPVGTTVNTLQFSNTDDFAAPIEVLTDAGSTSIQYTAKSLNELAGRVGLEGNIASTMYVRMKSVLAENLAPAYSNVYEMKVTPYKIDMSRGYILSSDKTDTGNTLYSPKSDGIYTGFMGASGWYNWWLQEGNGVTWGNVGDDGGGKPFVMSSNDQHWNFWFPGQTGCYYTIVNTLKQEWSALYIPTLTVSGDINGEMTYDKKANKWTLTYKATTTGTAKIRISGTGKQYNASTGTDDNAAVETPVAFGMENGKVTFGTTASDITVDVPTTGEVALTLDLSDPTNWTCTVGKPEATTETATKLYILGNDDKWDYTEYLTLYDDDNLCYAAAVNFNSSWGYYFSKEVNDWTKINQDPSSTDKKLVTKGSNIAQPGKGLYVVCASLGWMSYWYPMTDAITKVSFAGFNDKWDMVDMKAVDGKPGVYTATVTATADTPWGVQILLNGSWDNYFGTQTDGTLKWTKKENGAPKGWTVGKTYTFTVDLCNCTYTLTEQ